MTNMISVATGFQSSVNIAYDMNDDGKLKNYIPTKSALSLLEDVLLSTSQNSTDRARILIGAYGKGKSHIVLMILSILMKKDPELFEKMMPVISSEKPELYQLIQNYYHGSNKILPVVISGSSNSLAQAFLLALERTLAENELTDIMPETNYQAAINTIVKWKSNFPETYNCFKTLIDGQANKFIERLHDFDPSAYAEFEKLYPSLTAGSHFNPFVGFDVAELYEEVVKALKPKGYTGIYVIYDEFSKYLENHISDATKSDTKMLQDFAEKCGRSGKSQLHLMLISHKEITSYIERASKAMVDGWRGVSERFRHIYLNNNFTQTYEIIAAAIEKNEKKWNKFKKEYSTSFEAMKTLYEQHPLFSDFYEEGIDKVIYDCYPLHPVSTFVLPRLSERVAQNERTLFTFISAKGDSTLSSFLSQHADEAFALATPDLIYDYFEPLLKQEVYAGKNGVELSAFFNKKIGAGLFGGEGFIMQKASGHGIMFAEFDGHVVEYELEAGEQIVVDTGHLAAMTASCTMEIKSVPGVKNMLFGGEGVFNTILTGPGKVWLQTMPISNVAGVLSPYFPSSSK